MPPSFGRPPAIQRMRGKLASAFSAASALVAFESLTMRMPRQIAMVWLRWGRPG